MKRRDLLKLLGASVGGLSLAACMKRQTTGAGPGELGGARPSVPSSFAFIGLVSTDVELRDATIDHFRLDCAATDQDGAYCTAVETTGKTALYFVPVDYSGWPPGVLYPWSVLRTGDLLGQRAVLGIHNYDCNKNGDLAAILSFTDTSAGAGGPKVTKEVWLRRWGGSWTRMLYDGFVSETGQILTGVFDDVDVHDDCNMLVTAWYRPRIDTATQNYRKSDPDYPNQTRIYQGVFSLQGGDVKTLTLELRDDQVQAPAGDGLATFGLIDMHDDGQFAVQAFPSTLRSTKSGRTGTADRAPFLVRGRVGMAGRGAALASTPVEGVTSPLFSSADNPIGDAYFGPRVGPNGAIATLVQTTAGVDLYYGGTKVVGTGSVLPGSETSDPVDGVNPPVFGAGGEIYFVAECPSGVFLCASNGSTTMVYYPRIRWGRDYVTATSLALGHVTDSVDSKGRIYMFLMLEDGTARLAVAVPQ